MCSNFVTIFDIINIISNRIIIFIRISGFVMLSIRDVPMYPQKYTKLILPISMATIYFLKSIFIKPQTILTRNAGVNGIAINRIKFVRDMFLNDFLYLFIFSLSFVRYSNLFPNPFLNIKYDIVHPMHVKTHDIINPNMFPKT